MVAPHGCITRQTSEAEPSSNQKFHNIRRARRTRDTSTRRAQHYHQQMAKSQGDPKPKSAGGHSGPPLHRGFVSINVRIGTVYRVSNSSITVGTNKRESATPGGMTSGCAGSRTCQPPGIASKWTFGVCQGGHRHRWSNQTNRYKMTQS